MKLQYLIFSLIGTFAPIYSVNNHTESVLSKTQQTSSFVKKLEKAIKKSLPTRNQALFLSAGMALGYYGLNNFESKQACFDDVNRKLTSRNIKVFEGYPWYNKLLASPIAIFNLPMLHSREFVANNILFKNNILGSCYGLVNFLLSLMTVSILKNDLKSNILFSLLIFSTITILNYEEVSKDKKDELINTEKN